MRTFATGYTSAAPDSGMAFKWVKADMSRVHRLRRFANQLTSGIAKTSKAIRLRKRRALSKLNQRIRNLMAEFHWKLASLLCSNFTLNLLPAFESSRISDWIQHVHERQAQIEEQV